jgi:hypothetical protein
MLCVQIRPVNYLKFVIVATVTKYKRGVDLSKNEVRFDKNMTKLSMKRNI